MGALPPGSSRRADVVPFVTKDGSEIRELAHPVASGVPSRASVAEATVPAKGATVLHLHRATEETYHFLAGRATMRVGERAFEVGPRDTVLIPPGVPHGLENPHDEPVALLCVCVPPYSHDDTFLLEGDDVFEERLRAAIAELGIRAEQRVFDRSCHSVEEAAAASGAPVTSFVKSVCMLDEADSLVVAVVKGEDRADPARVAAALGLAAPPRLARPPEMLARTLFPAGGTPPFGYDARFVVDERVLETPLVWGGGGSARALVSIESAEIVRATGARAARVRK